MKLAIAATLLLSIASIASLGFLMIHSGGDIYGTCLAMLVTGADCPGNALAFIDFHFGVLQGLTLAILIAALLIFGIAVLASRSIRRIHTEAQPVWHAQQDFSPSAYSQHFTYWLALHENSPTLS